MKQFSSSFLTGIVVVYITFLNIGCSSNNVTIDNSLEFYFSERKLNGCFALLNNAQEQFTIYNLNRYRDSAYMPGGTFHIVISLVGLNTGKIFDEKTPLLPTTSFSDTVTLQQGFAHSNIHFFQQAVQRIGNDTMQFWLDSLHYGKYKKPLNIDSFWFNHSLKITPDEQLGFIKQLYFNQLPFDKRPQRIVKKLMLRESNTLYQLSYQSGEGLSASGKPLVWMVGWIEENQHPYFFVLNAEGQAAQQATGQVVLKNILLHLGFLKGNK